MPQIEQLQPVHWGSLRPDPIELDPTGINVATGANGSGKTCLLDAAKLILGVDQLKQKPNEYIFDGRGNPTGRADRAYVKAIFRNPERPGRAGRIFADAGRGCELADKVTAICEVTADRRRYTILAGASTWGVAGRRLEDELRSLEKLSHSHWLGPRQWSDLLARAGVSRALLAVISVKQGETDRAIDGSPEDLLRRMLELTGKQQTLDEFRQARMKLAKAREEYHVANERFLSENRELARLKAQAARHEEFLRTEARRKAIEELELPTAHRRAREHELNELQREREQRQGQLQQSIEEIEALGRELPVLERRLDQLELAVDRLIKQSDQARSELELRSGEQRAALIAVEQASADLVTARAIVDPLDDLALARLEHSSASAGQRLLNAESERERLAADIAELEAGRPPRPDGLDGFRTLLREREIETLLLAERLEIDEGDAVAAEAVLDRGVWTLVVPAERYVEAVNLAREHGYRLPLARAGDGKPIGVFSTNAGVPTARAYLAEIDMTLTDTGDRGVAHDGLVSGDNWATFRAPKQAALGERARQKALELGRARMDEFEVELPRLQEVATQARNQATAVAAGLAAKERIDRLTFALDDARAELEAQRERASAASRELAQSGPELGRLREEAKSKRQARLGAEARRIDLAPRVSSLRADVEALERELDDQPLAPSQAALGELPTIDALQHELGQVVLPRLDEFKEEERSSLAPIQRDDQATAVAEAEEYLAGRDDVVRQAEVELERARKSYDEHIRQTMQALNRSFREVCEQAGMEGEVKLVPSAAVEGEWALDVRVAHNSDEPKKPYQSREHSGGQRAKISILLLLAAMSTEGAADLLIMDEHIAHLDSQNIDYVAEVMSALKGKVQFLLATPTNAEAGRLTWCDHQLAFLPRQKGEPYSPPIRLFTRLRERDQPGEIEPAREKVSASMG